MYSEWGTYLAEKGFVSMAINYRLASLKTASWPDVIKDVRMAINWLVYQANKWNIDPQRIGVIGDSAGAYLGSLFTLQSVDYSSFKIRAVVGAYGVYDLTQAQSDRESQMYKRMMGVSFREAPNQYREASPINYVKEAASNPTFDTDFLLLYGDADRVVPPSQSENFLNHLKNEDVNVKSIVFPDHGHFWFNLLPGVEGGTLDDYPNRDLAPKIVEFLKEKLCIPVIGNFSSTQIRQIKTLINKK